MPKIVDKQKKSEAISRASLKVFRELGYHASRMADIAHAAGVGKGTLYEYFENKSDVLRSAFKHYFASFRAGAMQVVGAVDGPAAKLLALMEFAIEHAGEWEDHCAVYVDYLGVERSSRDAISLGSIYGEMRELLVELIQQGQTAGAVRLDIEPTDAAEALLSVYDGIVLHRTFEERHCNMAAARSAELAIIAQGLQPSGGRKRSPMHRNKR